MLVRTADYSARSGGPLHESDYRNVWARAPELVFDEAYVASPLAGRTSFATGCVALVERRDPGGRGRS